MTFEEFRTILIKRCGHKKFKISGSIGVREVFRWFLKNKWPDIGKPINESLFYSVIRLVNQYFIEKLLNGEDVCLPCKMGRLEVRRVTRKAKFDKNNKLRISYPIDWYNTLKLWYNDDEAKENKVLVRFEDRYGFCFIYNKHNAEYANKSFYDFDFPRSVKIRMKEKVTKGDMDALPFQEKN